MQLNTRQLLKHINISTWEGLQHIIISWEKQHDYLSALVPSFEKPLRHESEVEEEANAQAEAQKVRQRSK